MHFYGNFYVQHYFLSLVVLMNLLSFSFRRKLEEAKETKDREKPTATDTEGVSDAKSKKHRKVENGQKFGKKHNNNQAEHKKKPFKQNNKGEKGKKLFKDNKNFKPKNNKENKNNKDKGNKKQKTNKSKKPFVSKKVKNVGR